ncbi:ComF family protein [Sciscionella sediminilitoris]|uniref:ComF family protein n=1 Tax=Sciscionella sediminilitoris TaxID=1445613 RepID=UPI0004DF62DB|nr:ComF family protein [Sciscionella sp. SE31]
MPLAELVDLVLPRTCVGCAARGSGWCARCRAGCARPVRLPGPSRLARLGVYAITGHTGSARAAVLAYKERNRRDLARELAGVFATAVPGVRAAEHGADRRTVCLVPAPSARRASVARGGAHMSRIAREVAALLGDGARVAEPFALTRGVRDSVGLDRGARLANLTGHLRLTGEALPGGEEAVVLLDDVVTTGATVTACARALRSRGVRPVAALALTSPARP